MPHANGDITAAESFYRDYEALSDIVSAQTVEDSGAQWWRDQATAQALVIRDEDTKRSVPDLHQTILSACVPRSA